MQPEPATIRYPGSVQMTYLLELCRVDIKARSSVLCTEPSSVLWLLVVRPGAPLVTSSVLAPSSDALCS